MDSNHSMHRNNVAPYNLDWAFFKKLPILKCCMSNFGVLSVARSASTSPTTGASLKPKQGVINTVSDHECTAENRDRCMRC